MPIPVACPNPACARVSRAPDDAVGKRVKCPGCGRPFTAAATTSHAAAANTADGRAGDTQPPAPAPPAAAPAQSIGRFVVRSKLGAGAFGAVYRAYDPQLDREVALKVPHAAVLDSPKRVERFLREAKAAANLRHPHVVPVYDAGKDGQQYYIASAFIAGQKLADAVEDASGGLPFDRAARLVRELAEALAYAHEQGVVHRDVKPDNVMLDAQDRVHLMDFGLAARQDDEASRLTSDGAVMGTPAYMAPEQAAGRTAEVGPAADQYAVGVVLYELLTGRTPFAGPVPVVIHNQIHTDPEPPSKTRKDVPRDLETICLKAMSKRPQDRYPDCQSLADDLRRYLEGEPITARRLSAAEQLARWARKNKAVAGLAIALAVSLVAGATTAVGLAVRAQGAAERASTEARRADREAEEARRASGQSEENARLARSEQARATEEKQKADNALVQEQQQRATAAARLRDLQRESVNLALTQGQSQCLNGDTDRGLHWLARAYAQADTAGLQDLRGTAWTMLVGWQQDAHRLQAILSTPGTAALSPDGRHVLIGQADGQLQLWDVETAAAVGRKMAQPSKVSAVAFAPDGRMFASGGGDGTVRLWEAETGREVWASSERHQHGVGRLAFSPDGRRLASTAGEDTAARVWDAATGKPVGAPLRHNGRTGGVAFSPTGKLLTACWDRTAQFWDVETSARDGAPLVLAQGLVHSVAVHPSGRAFATGILTGRVAVWETGSNRSAGPVVHHQAAVQALAYSPAGDRLLTGAGDGTARLWDAVTGHPVGPPLRHVSPVTGLGFAPGGRRFMTAAVGPGGVRVWETPAADRRASITHGRPTPAVNLRAAADTACRTAVTSNLDGRVRAWRLPERTPIGQPLVLTSQAWGLALSPGGERVAVGAGATVRMYLLPDWKPLPLEGESPPAGVDADPGRGPPSGQLEFSPDGRFLFASSGAAVKLWAVEGGATVRTFTHDGPVTRVSVSPSGKLLAAGETGGTVRVWNALTGEPVGAPIVLAKDTRFNRQVRILRFSPDGERLIATTFTGRSVRVWGAATGGPASPPIATPGVIIDATFSPDGKTVLTASEDGAAQLWDAVTGKAVGAPLQHSSPVNAVGFTPDGQAAVTASSDTTVRFWDVRSGRPAGPPRGHLLPVGQFRIAADGLRMVAWNSTWDGVAVWDLPPLGAREPPPRATALVEVITGVRMADNGSFTPLSSDAWAALRKGLSP